MKYLTELQGGKGKEGRLPKKKTLFINVAAVKREEKEITRGEKRGDRIVGRRTSF